MSYESPAALGHLQLDDSKPWEAYLKSTAALCLEILNYQRRQMAISSRGFQKIWQRTVNFIKDAYEKGYSHHYFCDKLLWSLFKDDPLVAQMQGELLHLNIPIKQTAPLILKALHTFMAAQRQNNLQDIHINIYSVLFCADMALFAREKIPCEYFIFATTKTTKRWYRRIIERSRLFFSEIPPGDFIPLLDPPLARAANNLYWFQYHQQTRSKGANPVPRADYYARYLEQVFLPFSLQSCLYEEPGYNTQPGIKKTSPSSPDTSITLGEEIELGELMPDGKVKQFPTAEIHDIVEDWNLSLEVELRKNNITDYELSHTVGKHCDRSIIEGRIGEFHLKIFNDGNVIEVNCTPYTAQQTFLINGRLFTAPDILDLLIFPVAHQLGHAIYSGHKHVDVRTPFNKEPESLFRLLVDVQHQDYLPAMFGRENSSLEHFPYYKDQGDEPDSINALNYLIKVLNHSIEEGLTPIQNSDFSNLCSLRDILAALNLLKHRGPLCIRYFHEESGNDVISAKVTNDPETTMEFRLFQAPYTGRETKDMNRLILHWIEKARRQTRDRRKIELLQGMTEYDEGAAPATKRFQQFVTGLSLHYPTYKRLAERCRKKQIVPTPLLPPPPVVMATPALD